MPILWRYLLKNYLQIFFLCVSSFVAILLVTRLQDIARFASLGSKWHMTLLFTLYQVPYMLPIAIAISALIAAMLLMKKLSSTHELTAIRASGLGIKELCFPILMTSIVLSIGNFLITSELTPYCRLQSHELINKITSMNPLFLMQKSKLLKLKDSYVDMKMQQVGKEASDVIFIMNNQASQTLSLLLAKNLSIEDHLLYGTDVSYISYSKSEKQDTFNNLLIENQHKMKTKATTFAEILRKSRWEIALEHYPLQPLIRRSLLGENIKPKRIKKTQSEICRRFFFPLATISLTMVGLSYGLQIGRSPRKRGLYIAICLGIFVFACFLIGRSFELAPLKSGIFYFLPHPLIFILCLRKQRQIAGGLV